MTCPRTESPGRTISRDNDDTESNALQYPHSLTYQIIIIISNCHSEHANITGSHVPIVRRHTNMHTQTHGHGQSSTYKKARSPLKVYAILLSLLLYCYYYYNLCAGPAGGLRYWNHVKRSVTARRRPTSIAQNATLRVVNNNSITSAGRNYYLHPILLSVDYVPKCPNTKRPENGDCGVKCAKSAWSVGRGGPRLISFEIL